MPSSFVLISADMEGISGVTHGDDVAPGSPGWSRFREIFTDEVSAVAQGLFAGGVERVMVTEAHSTMRNLLIEKLDERIVLSSGRHKRFGMMHGIDEAEGVAFVGYHTRARSRGVLAHTYRSRSVLDVKLDGVPVSEGAMNTALAAEFGVPVILVSGDDLTCMDAAGYAPEAQRVAVKTCISRYAAECLHPNVTQKMLAEAATLAASRIGARAADVRPRTVEIDLEGSHLADGLALVPTVRATSDYTVEFTSSTMAEAFTTFRTLTMLIAAIEEGDWG